MIPRNVLIQTEVVRSGAACVPIVDPPSRLRYPPVAVNLDLKPGDKVATLELLRMGDGVPILIARHYMTADRFPDFAKRFEKIQSITKTFAATTSSATGAGQRGLRPVSPRRRKLRTSVSHAVRRCLCGAVSMPTRKGG